MIEWEALHALIEKSGSAEIAAALRDLTPVQRKALAAPLTAFERELRSAPHGIASWRLEPRLLVAAAAVLPSAAVLAPWLLRHRTGADPRWVLEALLDREVAWLPDLAGRIAGRLSARTRDTGRWQLTAALVEASGTAPPDDAGFLFQYATHGPVEWLREKPGWAALVPKMLMVEGVGPQLAGWWSTTLGALAGDGLLDRSALLDACLARLQRGGRASAMAGFLALHAGLAPDIDEIARLARDHIALLPDAPSTVAGEAQELLRRLDRAGRLELELFLEASRRLLARTEKKLVRAQLSWIEEVIAREPAQLDALVRATTTAFAHPAADVQHRALALVLTHLHRVAPATRLQVDALAATLPPDLAARLGVTPPVEKGEGISSWVPRAMPPPIRTLPELTRECLTFFRRSNTTTDAIPIERILAAVVAFAHSDRTTLAGALAPVFESDGWMQPRPAGWAVEGYGPPTTYSAMSAVLGAAAVDPTPGPEPDGREVWQAALDEHLRSAPERAIVMRLQEIAMGLTFSPRPALVSTPTTASGLIAPDALDERLRAAAAQGWEPWPLDLAHARLRLPAAEPIEATRWEVPRRIDHSVYGAHTDQLHIVASAPGVGPVGPTQAGSHAGYVRWWECWPSLLPAHRDVAAAHLLRCLFDQVEGRSGSMPLLPLLAEADGPIGEGMRLALAYGLGAGRPENRVHAVDALLTLAARGQLDGAPLGAVVGQLVAREVIVLNRIVPALRDVARAGAARPVWELIVAALAVLWPAAGARPVARLADLIALGVELAQQLEPTATIPGLAEAAARRGSSRVVAEAKRLAAAVV